MNTVATTPIRTITVGLREAAWRAGVPGTPITATATIARRWPSAVCGSPSHPRFLLGELAGEPETLEVAAASIRRVRL